jgi:hypothetical protein
MNILRDPIGLEIAKYLARRVKDDTAPATERMFAAVVLADLAAPTVLDTARDAVMKPQYKFVNGARVRVK